jgi:hypothetical protein
MDILVTFGLISVVLATWSFVVYLKSILRGETRPHLFTWILWTLLTWIAFVIQVYAGAGPGAWATGVAAVLTSIIFIYAIRFGDREYKRSDWVALILGLMSIPLWMVTEDPTWSAILVTIIDAFGFYPTIRKSWVKPKEESLLGHSIPILKHAFSIAAIQSHSIASTFYPAVLLLMNVILVAVIYVGRRRV